MRLDRRRLFLGLGVAVLTLGAAWMAGPVPAAAGEAIIDRPSILPLDPHDLILVRPLTLRLSP